MWCVAVCVRRWLLTLCLAFFSSQFSILPEWHHRSRRLIEERECRVATRRLMLLLSLTVVVVAFLYDRVIDESIERDSYGLRCATCYDKQEGQAATTSKQESPIMRHMRNSFLFSVHSITQYTHNILPKEFQRVINDPPLIIIVAEPGLDGLQRELFGGIREKHRTLEKWWLKWTPIVFSN